MYSIICDWCENPGSTLSSFNHSGSLSASSSSPQHRAMGTHPLAGWEWGHLTVSSQWAMSPRESLVKSMQWTGAWKRINNLHWHGVTSEWRPRARTGLNCVCAWTAGVCWGTCVSGVGVGVLGREEGGRWKQMKEGDGWSVSENKQPNYFPAKM